MQVPPVLLGQGSFGQVYRLGDKEAVKIINLNRDNRPWHGLNPLELDVMTTHHHPNIMAANRVEVADQQLKIYMPLMEGSLGQLQWKADWSGLKKVWTQLLLAVTYLHKRQIMHLDIKPHNVLINSDLSVKLIDFGLARYRSLGFNAFCGRERITITYRPPESLEVNSYDLHSDIWSLALTFIFTIIRQDPVAYFEKDTISKINRQHQQLTASRIGQTLDTWLAHFPLGEDGALVRKLLTGMLNFDHSQRLTAEQCCQLLCPGHSPITSLSPVSPVRVSDYVKLMCYSLNRKILKACLNFNLTIETYFRSLGLINRILGQSCHQAITPVMLETLGLVCLWINNQCCQYSPTTLSSLYYFFQTGFPEYSLADVNSYLTYVINNSQGRLLGSCPLEEGQVYVYRHLRQLLNQSLGLLDQPMGADLRCLSLPTWQDIETATGRFYL